MYLYNDRSEAAHIEANGGYVSELTLCGANRGLNRTVGKFAPKKFQRSKTVPDNKRVCKNCIKIMKSK